MSTRLTFVWDKNQTKFPQRDLAGFTEAHRDWLRSQEDSNGVLCAFRPSHVDAFLGLYTVDDNAQTAEHEFAALCDRHNAIGICRGDFLSFPPLRPYLKWPADQDLSPFLELGWDETHIAAIRSVSIPTETIHARLKGATGRLLCTPAFLEARDALHQSWLRLSPELRPALPFMRSARFSSERGLTLQPALAELVEFGKRFDEFCDEWQLLGMTTWSLPEVCGPHWVPGLAKGQAVKWGELTAYTPWHFPILASDGLGRVLIDEHQRRSEERGVEDANRWETHAEMLDVIFWEATLEQRYARHRVKAFKSDMEAALANVLQLTKARVHKLRSWAAALQSGRLSSLRGVR